MSEAAEETEKKAKFFMYSMMLGMLVTGSANTLIQAYQN